MKKIKIGDIFEINTPKGKGYLHFVHKDTATGELVRVLQGLYSQRPTDIGKLASSKERYFVSFPLAAAVKKKIVEQVGFYPASNYNKPKFMRTEYNVRGEFLGWHIVDADTWQRQLIKDLTDEQIKLSPWGIWNDTFLIENLVNNFSLEKWR